MRSTATTCLDSSKTRYKVSVLVSVYDDEPYIERCVRSLFEQTYPNLEYVFVDDCSRDKCIDIIERVMKDYPEREASVKIIRHKVNRGLAAVRNTAFDNATGEFICVVDGDDWMELDGIERLVDEQIATDADVVWGKALMHNEDGVVELTEPRYKDLEEWRMCYFGYEWELKIVNWRRIIRRDLLERYHIRHEEGQHIGNDKQLMPLIAYYAQSFSTVDAIVYHYERRNPHAHTYMNHHHHYDLSAYTKEIECIFRLIRFLKDKEPKYLETTELWKMKCLLKFREKALRNGSREGFRIMNNWIIETPVRFRKPYGWTNPLKTRLRSNYTLSLLSMRIKDTIRR